MTLKSSFKHGGAEGLCT